MVVKVLIVALSFHFENFTLLCHSRKRILVEKFRS